MVHSGKVSERRHCNHYLEEGDNMAKITAGNDGIRQIARQYWKFVLWSVVGVTLVGLIVMQAMLRFEYVNYLVFSSLYTLIVGGLYAAYWKRIAQHSPRVLTHFYMGGSVVKMLLALATALVGLCILRGSSTDQFGFAAIFTAYYLLTLFCDSFYFARVERRWQKDVNLKDGSVS